MKRIMGLSACVLAGSANAAIVTFNGTAGEGAFIAMGAAYSESGFTVTNDGGDNYFFDNNFFGGGLASWDDDLLFFNSETASQVTFTNSGAAPFNFNSAWLGSVSSAATITLQGNFVGGGSIILDLPQAEDSRTFFTFTGFDNLSSLVVSAPVDGQFALMDDFSFDTIVTGGASATVAEPISLGLLGLGLAGITLTNRKKAA